MYKASVLEGFVKGEGGALVTENFSGKGRKREPEDWSNQRMGNSVSWQPRLLQSFLCGALFKDRPRKPKKNTRGSEFIGKSLLG